MGSAAHAGTLFLGSRFPDTFHMVFVLGFPKSGTTFASDLVADYLRLPFPKLALLPHTFSCVVHSHRLPHPRYTPLVYVVRDGRDVALSYYHTILRAMLTESDRPTRDKRRLLPRDPKEAKDVRKHLPRLLEGFLRHVGTAEAPWPEHCRAFLNYSGPRSGVLRYERLLTDGVEELSTCIRCLTGEEPERDRIEWALEKYSFARQTKRAPGQEDVRSAKRKGIAGDWKSHFSREAAQIFDDLAGDVLIELGYEPDHSWVERCSP